MKNLLWSVVLFVMAFTSVVNAQMVKEENYLRWMIYGVGTPDFPPFSYYYRNKNDRLAYAGAFVNPILNAMKKYRFAIDFNVENGLNFLQTMLAVREGRLQLLVGAYADTKIFRGVVFLKPAVVSNPIHVITLPETQEKIKKAADLKNLRGVISKGEYLSDFVLRKIKELNIKFVDTPLEAYEMLFVGDVDYIMGSKYYNRMMASKYGIERYLAYSKSPLFKIPVYVALSKETRLLSEYQKAFETEFAKKEFATAVKKEILRIVQEEVDRNVGIVPPAFAKKVIEEAPKEDVSTEIAPEEKLRGGIIEKEEKHKTIDEVLEGI